MTRKNNNYITMAKELKQYFGENVRLLSDNGHTYVGKVGDVIEGKYNEPSYEDCIILDYPTRDDGKKEEYPIQFNESEIVSITII